MIDSSVSEKVPLREFLEENGERFFTLMKELYDEYAQLKVAKSKQFVQKARDFTQDFDKNAELGLTEKRITQLSDILLSVYDDLVDIQKHYKEYEMLAELEEVNLLIDQFIKAITFFESKKK